MPNQVQCPNCGSYKVTTKIRKVSPISGKEYPADIDKSRRLLWFAVIFGFLWFLGWVFNGPNWEMALLGLFMVGAGIFLLSWYRVRKDAVNRYYHHCELCGNNWNHMENEPGPPITIRPDLIEKGAEEQKRQQEGAAAAFYEQQRRNNLNNR
jgi:hypothetical protein